jgi:hypothetical protein
MLHKNRGIDENKKGFQFPHKNNQKLIDNILESYSKIYNNFPCCLPYGKADDTASPSLFRARGMRIQLRPCRLGSAASSTFAAIRRKP